MIAVRRVTVHCDGAVVEREGSATIEAGRVIVPGLPLQLDRDSLRVHVSGGEVRTVRLQPEIPDVAEAPELPSESRADIEADLRRVEAEIAALQVERQAAVQLAPGWDPEGGLPSPERVTRWAELEAAVGPWVERVDYALRDARTRREELTSRANELPLAAEGPSPAWESWQPTQCAVLEVDGEGEVRVQVSYRIAGARWSPAYQLDADAQLTQGRLVLRASVAQATGEDWRGVDLRLSSSTSHRAVAMPALLPFRMGAAPPLPPPAWRAPAEDFESLFGAELPPAPAAGAGAVATWSDDEDLQHAETLVNDESWEVEGLVEDQLVEIAAAGQEDDDIDPARRFEIPEIREVPQAPAELEDDTQDTAITGLVDAHPAGHEVGAAARRSQPEPILTVGAALLDYDQVELAGAREHDTVRGRLVVRGDQWPSTLSAGARRRLVQWRAEAAQAQRSLADQPLPEHHVAPASVGGIEVEHRAEGAVDLPCDGSARWVAVFSEPLRVDVRYTAVPRNELRAYRRIRAKLERPTPLLPGPFQVFVGGDLETTVAWEGASAGDPLDLSLGVEDRISIARNVKYGEEEQQGGRRFHTTVDVRVTSGLSREVSVQLIERVPIPDGGDGPEVEITTSTPIAKPYQGVARDLEGAKVQTLEVPPNGEARAVLGYVIGLRSGQEMEGGDHHGG